MKSPFFLPALCAAAVHVAFLLGTDQVTAPGHRSAEVPEPADERPSLRVAWSEPASEVLEVATTNPKQVQPLNETDYLPPSPVTGFEPKADVAGAPPMFDELLTQLSGPFVQAAQSAFTVSGAGTGGSGIQGTVFSPDALDEIPTARLRVPPQYPESMRRIGAEAVVQVSFVVDPEGRVTRVMVDAEAPVDFARAAESALRRWRFEPGKRNGRPVSFRMSVPLVFALSSS